MLDSASVNSISSIPSAVYQWRKAFRLNMAVNCSEILLNLSLMLVECPRRTLDMGSLGIEMSQMLVLMLFGIDSTKYELFLFWTLSNCSSASDVEIFPLNIAAAVRYLPCLGSEAHIMFLASNICWVSSGTVRALYPCETGAE